jgi:glycerol kinase
VSVVIAVDAGTTGVRAIAFDHRGRSVQSAYRELSQHFPRPGWVEHDPDEIWSAVQHVLGELTALLRADGHDVVALGITNQRETVVAWDRRDGRPLHRAIVWQDRRTAARCAELIDAGHLDLVRQRTGLVLDPYFSASKLEWLFTEGGVDRGPHTAVGTVDSWLVWRLTDGQEHLTDTTNASRTLLLDITTGEWSEELCELFGVPPAVLPEVRPSSGRVAMTTSNAACGAGIPISGVAGDQHAALFGQSCFAAGQAKCTFGTGSFVLVNVGDTCPAPVDGLLTTIAWTLPDHQGPPVTTYAYEGSVFATGASVQWLRDGLGLIQSAPEVDELATSVDDAGGVVIVPAFAGLGSPWWDPHARGTILGLTRGTGRAHLARAVLESIAFQTRDVAEAMAAASGRSLDGLRADGGGASDAVLQLVADQIGDVVTRPVETDTTALGAAHLAGLAEGFWSSLAELRSNWVAQASFTPTPDRADADAAHARWLRAVERALHWTDTPPS